MATRYATGGIPNGDAFLVQTPESDYARNQLYQETDQRAYKAKQDAQALDLQMAKEFGGVRNTDSGETISDYNDYKTLAKQAMFDPKLQGDPDAMAKVNQQKNIALSKVYGGIQRSKETKQMADDLLKAYAHNPYAFQDNFKEMHSALMDTPSSKLGAVKLSDGKTYDLSNPEAFYDTTPRADIGKLLKAAHGPVADRSYEDAPIGTQGLQVNRTTYKYGTNPADFETNITNQLHEQKAGKTAAAAWAALSPTDIAKVDQAYEALTPQDWKRRTGSETPQQLHDYDPNNPAASYGTYLTKLYATQNQPIAETKPFDIKENIKALDETNRVKNMGIRFNYQRQLQQSGAGLALGNKEAFYNFAADGNNLTAEQANHVATTYMNGAINTAAAKPPVSYTDVKGKTITGNPIDVLDQVKDQLALPKGSHKIRPNETIISPDKNTIIGVFKSSDASGKETVVTTSQPVSAMTEISRAVLNKGKSTKGQPVHSTTTPAAAGAKPKFF